MKHQPNRTGPQVRTTSHFHAWWLVAFKGYRVRMKTLEPQQGFLRRLRYATTWLLEAPRCDTRAVVEQEGMRRANPSSVDEFPGE